MGMGQVMPIPIPVPTPYSFLAYPPHTHLFQFFILIPIPIINEAGSRTIPIRILKQYDLVYVPQRAVKGQALADFLAGRPIPDDWELNDDLPEETYFSSIFSLHGKCILMELQDETVLVQE